MSKYIITAMKNPCINIEGEEALLVEEAIDLVALTDMNPRMIMGVEMNGEEGAALLVESTSKAPDYAYFVSIQVLIEFCEWKMANE
jgi:hypothetical protein